MQISELRASVQMNALSSTQFDWQLYELKRWSRRILGLLHFFSLFDISGKNWAHIVSYKFVDVNGMKSVKCLFRFILCEWKVETNLKYHTSVSNMHIMFRLFRFQLVKSVLCWPKTFYLNCFWNRFGSENRFVCRVSLSVYGPSEWPL